MAAQIRPTRLDVTDRFPMLGFTIRTSNPPRVAEVVLATDLALFSAKEGRSTSNFYTSREHGLLTVANGEAVYVVPPDVLGRFVAADRLYFGLATATPPRADDWTVELMPVANSPYVSLSGLSDRALRRVRMFPARRGSGRYAAGSPAPMLDWAGDRAQPGMIPAGAQAPAAAPAAPPGNGGAAAPPANIPYDDGFGPLPPLAKEPAAPPAAAAQAYSRGLEDDEDDKGIEGPVLDEEPAAPQAMALGGSGPVLKAAEYDGVTKLMPSPNFAKGRAGSTIDRIVIHITGAGQTPYLGSWFTNPKSEASSHYMVDQLGNIIQFVREEDTAWHAGKRAMNRRSIGIEHVAVQKGGADYGKTKYPYTPPSDVEYRTSAVLVAHLCVKYGLTPDRTTIIGHREANPKTSHSVCPDGAWDWDAYMALVAAAYAVLKVGGAVKGAIRTVRDAIGLAHGLEVDPERMGIEGPVLDEAPSAPAAMALAGKAPVLTAAEYPGVTKLMPSPNYTEGRGGKTLDRIVIHITAAGQTPHIGTWFTKTESQVSAHYMVDQLGNIIQFVREQDTAWHAHGVNGRSIGIEHVAVPQGGTTYGKTTYPYTPPSEIEYRTSAVLVAHLCRKYGLTPDRTTIVGHSEVDSATSHSNCPDGAWDWDLYMGLVGGAYAMLAAGSAVVDVIKAVGASVKGAIRAIGDAIGLAHGLEADPEAMGIDGPACSEDGAASALAATALALGAKEYDRVSRVAISPAFTPGRSGKSVNRIVIHITDAPTTSSTVSHFTRKDANSSAHYLVGQDGEIVQFVSEADTAWHAKGQNSNSIGIEHVAVKTGGATYGKTTYPHQPPTDVQYVESAALVCHLCDKYGLTPDRTTIIGHREADPKTPHASCPDGAWDWAHFMDLVTSRAGAAQPTGQGLSRAMSGGTRLVFTDRPTSEDWHTVDYPDVTLTEVRWEGEADPVAFVFFGHAAIDFDGSPTAYHPDDTGDDHLENAKSKDKNGVPIKWAGVTSMRPSDELVTKGTVLIDQREERNINGKYPVIQRAENGDPRPGYYVSTTSIVADRSLKEYQQNRFLDASSVSYGALSGRLKGCGVKLRDYGLAIRHDRDLQSGFYFADSGSTKDPKAYALGEVSHKVGKKLGGSGRGNRFDNNYPVSFIILPRTGGTGALPSESDIDASVASAMSALCRASNASDLALLMAVNEVAPGKMPRGKAALDAHLAKGGATPKNYATIVAGLRKFGFNVPDAPAQGQSYQAQGLSSGDWSVNWDDVDLIAQPTGVSCWATAAAMVDGWRRRQSVSIDEIAAFDNLTVHKGLPLNDAARFGAAIGFTVQPNACYTPEGFRGILEANGPLWVAGFMQFPSGLSGHAVVVTGMYRENGNYFVRLTDPWDHVAGNAPGRTTRHDTGSRYILTWEAFSQEYEATGGQADFAQLLHTDGTHGHTLNRGSAKSVGYAQSAGDAVPPSSGGDDSLGFGTCLTRRTEEKEGRRYDLAQLSGMVQPANALAGGAGAPALPGERVVLDDWPYIEGPTGRTQAGVAIDWQFQGGAVGNVAIAPIEGQVLDGWSAAVRADIARDASTPERVNLNVRVTSTFSRQGEQDQVAVTEVLLGGDGRRQTRHGAGQTSPAPAPGAGQPRQPVTA